MRPKTLVSTVGAVVVAAGVGGLASRPAESAWYARLKKPGFQPPRQAFPIVWPILYADIAAVSASSINDLDARHESEKKRAYVAALAANLVLNASWSWLFFTKRLLGTSAIAAGVLTVSSADLTRRAAAVRGTRAAPLALYPLWCAFATVLSIHIWVLNRRS